MANDPAQPTAPVPPQNLDAEEYVLGAMLLSPHAITACHEILGDGRGFYRASHATIYRACVTLHERGEPADAITVHDELDRAGKLDAAGGTDRIREIAGLAVAAGNAGHYAQIVADLHTRRSIIAFGEQIARYGRDLPDGTGDLIGRIRDEAAQLEQYGVAAGSIELLPHEDVLQLELPADRHLVDDLIPAGAVGTIAAVPEAHKSWLAQAIAVRVAAGHGHILGKKVTGQGPVAYLWQDDSTREEAERVKAFENAHPVAGPLPILWGLNLGIQLPRDIPRLATTVQDNNLVLLVLDSYYNFLHGIDLKDEQAEQVVSALKRDICDATGCTVLIVDHMPWATDTNRSRLRAYGGVFKNAATRYGIYIDVIGDKLHIEARGNNIRGIPKTLAQWNPDRLELELLSSRPADDDKLKASPQEIYDYVREHGGSVEALEIRAVFEISRDTLTRRIQRLRELGIEYVGGTGRTARLEIVAAPAPPPDDDPNLLGEHASTQARTCVLADDADSEPHNDAGLRNEHAQPRTDTVRASESGDLQGKEEHAKHAPLRGVRVRARETPYPETTNGGTWNYAAAEQLVRDELWMVDDPATAIVARFVHGPPADLEKLIAVAYELAAAELGQGQP